MQHTRPCYVVGHGSLKLDLKKSDFVKSFFNLFVLAFSTIIKKNYDLTIIKKKYDLLW